MIDFGIKINIFIIHLSGRRSHGNGNILTHADNNITAVAEHFNQKYIITTNLLILYSCSSDKNCF